MAKNEVKEDNSIKIDFDRMKKIDSIYSALLEEEGFEHTKLAYAFKRFSEKNLIKPFNEFNSEIQSLRVDHALTDEKTGALLYQPIKEGQREADFQMNKDGYKNLTAGLKALSDKWDKKEFSVTPFICNELPANIQLTQYEKEVLEGLVI